MTTNPETAAEFLRERANWLRVETVDLPDGCWDVVLRIDGHYARGVHKAELVRFFEERLLEVFRTEGILPRQLHAWPRPAEREARP
jgi:hypothetical protein